MANSAQLLHELQRFTGTENYYHLPMLKKYVYTDGVRYLAQQAGAYWLLEHIFLHQTDAKIQREEFQVWKIQVLAEGGAKIMVEDGNDKVVKTFKIPFTDFPLPEFSIWFENNVLYLPSER